MRRDIAGSVVLLVVVAVLIVRPWEGERGAGPVAASAVVERVVDGDTIVARIGGDEERVRLIGIDTPETVKPGEPVECFGPQASTFAKRLLEGRRVRLVFGAERRDHYGRLLAYAYLPPDAGRAAGGGAPPNPSPPPGAAEGDSPAPPAGAEPVERRERFVNAILVRRGLARTLTIPPNDRYAPRLERLELRAARAGRGLWGACPP